MGRESPLATPAEVQAYLRLSRKSFDKHVRPHLSAVPQGGRIFYEWKEIYAWVKKQRVGPSEKMLERESTTFDFGSPDDGSTDPQVAATVRRLRKKQHDSTPLLYPVKGDRQP